MHVLRREILLHALARAPMGGASVGADHFGSREFGRYKTDRCINLVAEKMVGLKRQNSRVQYMKLERGCWKHVIADFTGGSMDFAEQEASGEVKWYPYTPSLDELNELLRLVVADQNTNGSLAACAPGGRQPTSGVST